MQTPLISPVKNDAAEVWTFFHGLEASRLLDRVVIAELRRNYSEDLDALSAYLLENQLLTSYQLRRIKDGQPRGLVLGQYQILDELGRGGFGVVYKASHTLMNRTVGLKVIAPAMVQSSEMRELFLREVKTATRLVHPNIAIAYDAGECEGTLFFAMEFISGYSLEQMVLKNGPLAIPMACAVILQAAQALQYAHEHGMAHRDIKPGNILMAAVGNRSSEDISSSPFMPYQVKVIDFGLARIFPLGTAPTQTLHTNGGILGTPAFMAPEQARNHHEADIRSDLYSLGCTFYYILSGQLPYAGTTTLETISLKMEGDPEPLATLRPGIPADILNIVKRLMEKNPSQRFQTPLELTESLGFSLWSYFLTQVDKSNSDPRSDEGAIVASAFGAEKGSADASKKVQATSASLANSPPTQLDDNLLDVSARELWTEWRRVVQNLIRRKPVGLDGREYKLIHRSLLAKVSDADNKGNDLPKAIHPHVSNLLEPWLALENLASLDRRILLDLWHSCERVNGIVSPRQPGLRLIWIIMFFAAIILLPASSQYFARGFPEMVLRLGTNNVAVQLLTAAGCILGVLIAFFAIRRKGRRGSAHGLAK